MVVMPTHSKCFRFDAIATREALNNDPDFRWCHRAGCESGQIHENGVDGNIFQCVACDFKVCVVHEDTWHEGLTCEEYDYRKLLDQQMQASVNAISQLTKKCPGKDGQCGCNIEKNGGCDHMTCMFPFLITYRQKEKCFGIYECSLVCV
jgi:E3 ubiquitin-protein ligase RNF14